MQNTAQRKHAARPQYYHTPQKTSGGAMTAMMRQSQTFSVRAGQTGFSNAGLGGSGAKSGVTLRGTNIQQIDPKEQSQL